MKLVKNYDNFSEEYQLNENILGKAWGAVANYFKRNFGKHAWLHYALYMEENGLLIGKNGEPMVELIYPESYLNGVKGGKPPTVEELEQEMKGKFKEGEKIKPVIAEDDLSQYDKFSDKELEDKIEEDVKSIEEAFVTLQYPVEGEDKEIVRNVNVNQLVSRVMRVYKMNLLRAGRHEADKYGETSKYQRKKTHALFIWGAPGIGKTEILHQVANNLDIIVQEWHLSQIEPTDFRGVPKVENIIKGSVDPKDERTVSKLPAIFPTSDGENGKGGIMFFDELNRAPEMVLSASLALALSGKFGDYRLPSRWIVLAAGNRPGDITSTQLTDDPILWNRFAHVNYAPSVENDWIPFATTQKPINPDLIAFLKFYKQYYHRLDTESKSPNWPSPRTWEMGSQWEYFLRKEDWNNLLPNCKDKKEEYDKIRSVYTRAVGKSAAIAFVEYLKLKEFYDEPNVRDVYEKGVGAKHLPKRPDQARAAAASIAFYKKDQKLKPQELKNVYDFVLAEGKEESVGGNTMEILFALVALFNWEHKYVKTEEAYNKIYWAFTKEFTQGLRDLN